MREDYFVIIDLRKQYGNVTYSSEDVINALSEITLNQHLDETIQIIKGNGFNLESEFIGKYVEEVKNEKKYYINFGDNKFINGGMEYNISNVTNSPKELKDFYEWCYTNDNFNLMNLDYYACYTNKIPETVDEYQKNDHIHLSDKQDVILCKGELYLKNKKQDGSSNLNRLLRGNYYSYNHLDLLSFVQEQINSEELKGNFCLTNLRRRECIENLTTSFPIYLAYIYRFGYIITTKKDNIIKFINALRSTHNDNIFTEYKYNDRFLEIPEYTYHEISLKNEKNEFKLNFKNNEFNINNRTHLNCEKKLTPEYNSNSDIVLLLFSGGITSVLSYIILNSLSYNVQMKNYYNDPFLYDTSHDSSEKKLTDTLRQLYENPQSKNNFHIFDYITNSNHLNCIEKINFTDLELIIRNSNFNFRDFINNIEYKYHNNLNIQKYINSLPLDDFDYNLKIILGGFIKKGENLYSQFNNLNYLNSLERTFKFTKHQVLINDITQNLTRTEKWKLFIRIGDVDKLIDNMNFKNDNQKLLGIEEKIQKYTLPMDPKLLYNITSLRLLNRDDLIDRIVSNVLYDNSSEIDSILNSYKSYYQKLSYDYNEKSFTEIIDKLIISEDEKNILESKFS